MESKRNIQKEIDRYLKYNYSKRDVIAFLKRDGYSDSEIKENISVFNKVDSNYFSNILHFLPALLFLLLTILCIVSCFYSEEDNLIKGSYLILTLVLIYFSFGFCKNKPFYIISTAVLILISTLYYSYVFFIVSEGDEFGFSLSIPSKISVLVLHLLTLRGTYKIYKEATSKS
ncbi:hypothetical protein [Flavobacterium sp.]|uniref:hypothetical protein n=1 Tax=Flavobacterium sp. TaxID=239 RepID=UPI0038D17933